MLHKTFDAIDIKADGDSGEFTATVAAFGNVDLVGDRILPGAFSKTLRKWQASGDPVPVILSHQHENPMAHVGVAYPQDMQETAKGLLVKGTLDIADNEVARQVYKLMKRRSLKEFSFGYKVPKGGEQRAKDGANELSEIDLFEVGPTLKGANPATELHAVKSALAEHAESENDPGTEAEPLDKTDLRRRSDKVRLELATGKLGKQDTSEGAEDEPSDDQPPSAQQKRILNSMIGQAQEFIDSGPDDEDAAEMSDILDALQELLSEPDTADDASGGKDSNAALRKALNELTKWGWEAPDFIAKAAWTTAYVNNLPDSAFLYIAPGGEKDSDGKTMPRSLRYFPVRDANGTVDQAHVRNALARIPQSNLPQSVKDTATAKAQRLLQSDNTSKAVEDARDEDRPAGKSRAQDLLRKRSDAAVLEIQSGGLSLRKPPKVKEPAKAEPLNEVELKRRSRNAMLAILTGVDSNEDKKRA